MKTLTITLVLLLLIPLATAFPCELTQDEQYCNEIKNSDLNETEKDLLFSSLLYQDNDQPNHNFIQNYNLNIQVNEPPNNTQIYNSNQIKNAWLSFLAVFPAVYENNVLYTPENTNVLSEYDYEVQIPANYQGSYPNTDQGDCKRTYQLVQEDSELNYYLNNNYKGQDKYTSININEDGTLKAQLNINTNLKVKHYHWHTYCCAWDMYGDCKKYCHECKYHHTDYQADNIQIEETKQIQLYTTQPYANLTIVNQYHNTTKGTFTAQNYSYFKLSFQESHLTKQNYYYDLVFEKKPYYIAYLEAHNSSQNTIKNLIVSNNTFFVKNTQNCSLLAYNHFYNFTSECDLTLHQETTEQLTMETNDIDLTILIYILTFLAVIYIIYKLLKSQWKKLFIPILIILLLIPFVSATVEEEECGITNLASCLPEMMYNYLVYLLSLPVLPLLLAIQELLMAEFSIEMFYHLWSVIRYIISFFYVFLFVYVGYVFLTSNDNPIQRAHAKDMLKNIFLMIILIQGSFYIYSFILDINSILNSVILSMIDPQFFMITADNFVNIALEGLNLMTYVIVLYITLLMLILRYVVVSFGVIFFPIAIFCYFIPPLKPYGKFIISVLLIFIFISFFNLLIMLVCSMLVEIPLFANIKISFMIGCFFIVIYTFWLAIKFTLKMSSFSSLKSDLTQAAKYIAMAAA